MPKNYLIPNIIKKLNPKIKAREYQILQSDPGFQDKVAFVCENCFLQISSSANQYENLQNMKQKFQIQNRQFYGIGKLMPEKTNRRFNQTINNINLMQSSYSNYKNLKNITVASQRNSQLTQTLYSRKNYLNLDSEEFSKLKRQDESEEFFKESHSLRKCQQLKEISDIKQTDFSTQDEDFINQRNFQQHNFKKLLAKEQLSSKLSCLQEHPKKQFFSSLFRKKQQLSQIPYLNESEISFFDLKTPEQRTRSQQELQRIKLKNLEVYSQNNFLLK